MNLYRAAQSEQKGRLCLNPEDPFEEQTWIDGNNPEHLLDLLENFAQHGTMAMIDAMGIQEFVLRIEANTRLKELRAEYAQIRRNLNGEKAVWTPMQRLAREFGKSQRAMERILGKSAK